VFIGTKVYHIYDEFGLSIQPAFPTAKIFHNVNKLLLLFAVVFVVVHFLVVFHFNYIYWWMGDKTEKGWSAIHTMRMSAHCLSCSYMGMIVSIALCFCCFVWKTKKEKEMILLIVTASRVHVAFLFYYFITTLFE